MKRSSEFLLAGFDVKSMINDRLAGESPIKIQENEFKVVCLELLKYGMLNEYFFKKAIENICVNSSDSLLDRADTIRGIYDYGDSLNKKFNDSIDLKTQELEAMINEETYNESKELIETAVYSVIIVKEESLANEIYLELVEDKLSIEKISADIDDDQIVELIEDIGPIFLSNVHPIVKKCIRSVDNGEGASRPVFIEQGWMLLQLKNYNKPPNSNDYYRDIAVRKLEEEAKLIAEQSLDLLKISQKN